MLREPERPAGVAADREPEFGGVIGERIMTDTFAQQSFQALPTPATVANVMWPALTTVEQVAHLAAAAHLMKHAGATALMAAQRSTRPHVGR